jgi:hypothetical protein
MLLGNVSVLNKNPGRAFAGSTVSDTRASWNKSGAARGFLNVPERAYSSLPNGCRPPFSWGAPQKAGGLSCTTGARGSGAVASLNLAGGLSERRLK